MCLQHLPAASGFRSRSPFPPRALGFPLLSRVCSHLAPGWVRLSFTGSQPPLGMLERALSREAQTISGPANSSLCSCGWQSGHSLNRAWAVREPRTCLLFARIDGIRGTHRELACLSDTQSRGQGDGILRTSPWKSGKSQLLSKLGSLSMIPNPPDQFIYI